MERYAQEFLKETETVCCRRNVSLTRLSFVVVCLVLLQMLEMECATSCHGFYNFSWISYITIPLTKQQSKFFVHKRRCHEDICRSTVIIAWNFHQTNFFTLVHVWSLAVLLMHDTLTTPKRTFQRVRTTDPSVFLTKNI